jgi:A118 family predicted phage portal protein
MGFFSNLATGIRRFFMSILPVQSIEKAMGVKFQDYADMPQLIASWRDAYMGQPDWLKSGEPSLNLATIMAKDLSKKAVGEADITAQVGTVDDPVATAFLASEVLPSLRAQTEYAVAMGGVVARPWYDQSAKRVRLQWFTADMVMPTSWDGKRMTGCMLVERVTMTKASVKTYYTKLEAHGWDEAGTYWIRSRVFKNSSDSDLGCVASLSDVPAWSSITPDVPVRNITTPLFVYIGSPWANNKALNVPTGVSVYKDAMDTFAEIDRTYAALCWEREAGKAAVFIDDSMVPSKIDDKGKPYDDMGALEKRLYRKLTGTSATGDKPLFEKWSPELRFSAYIEKIKADLALACMQCGLDAGAYLWDSTTGAVTAQQVRSEKQKTYGTIVDVQDRMLTPAVRALVDAARAIQQLYGVPEISSDVELSISWGDSILIAEETEKAQAMSEVGAGLRSKLTYLTEYRGMSEEEANAEIERIKTETPAAATFFGA